MKRRDAQLIRDTITFLDNHLYEDYSIVDLCKRFTINREKLQAGFQEQTGYTVHAYIIKQRMERAAIRLLESDESIKVVALDSGYKKQRSFNKTFKAFYNVTPAAYRRLHQPRAEERS